MDNISLIKSSYIIVYYYIYYSGDTLILVVTLVTKLLLVFCQIFTIEIAKEQMIETKGYIASSDLTLHIAS